MARVDISIRADLRLRPSPPSCADVSPTDASEPLLTPFSEFRDGFPPPPPPNFYHGIAGRGYFYFSDFSQWKEEVFLSFAFSNWRVRILLIL